MRGRYGLAVLLVGVSLLALGPSNQQLLALLITTIAIYFGYRLQMGSHEI
jgi:uncharacterized membrane protein YccC